MKYLNAKRTNKKPPKNTRCDAHIGVNNSGPSPQVGRCSNKATIELVGINPVGETWLCEDCANKILERSQNGN